MAQAPACPRPGWLSVLHRRGPINEDTIDPLRVLVRIIFERIRMGPPVRGAILHPRQDEDDEVGGESLSNEPAVLEGQPPGRHARHLVDRVWEGEDGLLDNEPLQDSRELAEGAGL